MRPPANKADGHAEFTSTDLPIDFDHDEPPTVQPERHSAERTPSR